MTAERDIRAITHNMLVRKPAYVHFHSGLLMADECRQSVIVSVPVDVSVECAVGVEDLALETWIPSDYFKSWQLINLDDCTAHVDHMPREDSDPDQVLHYTICFSPQMLNGRLNCCLKRLLPERNWHGNVLILKHGANGVITDLTDGERHVAEHVVVR
ncbi:hypothetical protein Hypma_012140 [Hypsizygus marmoreus]|uniref:Uncharacterized protein n=1 Tax=Hypsizygus marmoreus TaxID=39966 RepID=A0A369JPL7_HYPMA|nr:hypothetical protein Hypma_012140 [Hypsizygus marmoreus]